MTTRPTCPVPGCHKKFISEAHVSRHLEVMHKDFDLAPRLKGWMTPHGFVDFKEPVTYAEACEQAKVLTEAMRLKLNQSKEK